MAQSSIQTKKGANLFAEHIERDINFAPRGQRDYLRKHNLQPGDVKVRVEMDFRTNIANPQRTARFVFLHKVTSSSGVVTWKEVARCKGKRWTNRYLSTI